jgi:hypothetical protein
MRFRSPKLEHIALLIVLSFVGAEPLHAQPQPLRADFSDRARLWQNVRLADRANRFTVVEDAGRTVLSAESDRSASALWFELGVPPGVLSRVRWRWRVESSIPGNRREREKKGDDYAARFFVIFEDEPFSREARALCYVWAASEPVGSSYTNPYFENVTTIVLQSGDERAGTWVAEERDFIADYRTAFGESPELLTAVAVMVDTDNTRSSARAWFDDITIE